MTTAPDRLSGLGWGGWGCIGHLSTNDLTFESLRVQFDHMIAGKAAQSAATHGASRINNRGRTLCSNLDDDAGSRSEAIERGFERCGEAN